MWIVPADGEYRVYSSTELANHPWFHGDAGEPTLLRDGTPIHLRRGAIYSMTSSGFQPVGVFIVPASITKLFRHPLANVDIDGAPPPRWHVPQL
jgi:hypothetical protein